MCIAYKTNEKLYQLFGIGQFSEQIVREKCFTEVLAITSISIHVHPEFLRREQRLQEECSIYVFKQQEIISITVRTLIYYVRWQ